MFWGRKNNALLNEINGKVDQLIQQGVMEMSALSDLQAADAAIKAAVAAAITLIQNLQSGSVQASDVEAVVTDLNTAAASLSAALNPAPPVTP